VVWQWITLGSPLTTGYQVLVGHAGRDDGLGALFGWRYVIGPPLYADGFGLGGEGLRWGLPNLLLYPLQLGGVDRFLLLPGVGVVGLLGLVVLARKADAACAFGRFGLATIALTLLTYAPYYYQSGRFLMIPSVLLGVAAAVQAAHLLAAGKAALVQQLRRLMRRARLTGMAEARDPSAPGSS
jgi:hypothetical protein